ncbi:MAG: GtrA family protein [Oscillospiraceae bacterium]|nr:GtrA family protein [Oscillospiraceae bacterium]
MFDKILQFFVKLLPAPLKKLYDKYEELIIYIYYGLLTTILNLIVQGVAQMILNPLPISGLTIPGFWGWEGLVWDAAAVKTTIATAIAWTVAVIFAFYVNKKYVFKSVTKSFKQLMYEFWTFISARIASLFMEMVIMNIGAHFYSTDGETVDNLLMYWIFKFTAQVVVTLANYFFSKLVVFRKKKDKPAEEQPASDPTEE